MSGTPVDVVAPVGARDFCIGFSGAPAAATTSGRRPVLALELPWLAGEPTEAIFGPVEAADPAPGGSVSLYRTGDLLLGHACGRFLGVDQVEASRALYARVLSAVGERPLFRMWNYVPHINAQTGGLENYRAFCKGRSLAFEATLGGAYHPKLPAASAVGSAGTDLAVIFVAGPTPPRHLENPEQVPAYRYPDEHGPRSPSFARGTVATGGGRQWVFVSGTASIKGHATVAAGSLIGQIDCTLDNLRLISEACTVGERLGAGDGWTRHFKIYLRRAEDLAAAQAALVGPLLLPGDRVTWLQADICRAALDIEIEATLVRPL